MNYLVLAASLAFSYWLIRKDSAQREGVSRASWIPTLWVGVLCSRPISGWLGGGGGGDTLDGSPSDRVFYLAIIVLCLLILSQRRIHWSTLIVRNWPILFFYSFLLLSILWANSPIVSFKRWFKEIGNIFVALVILTEKMPMEAMRAVFLRCAYLFIPLSVVFIRHFPEWGRSYNRSGAMQLTGVTTQKNTLGAMILVCALMLLWEFVVSSQGGKQRSRIERIVLFLFAISSAWLLHLSDSKTSMLCLLIGGVIIMSLRLPTLQNRVRTYGFLVLIGSAILVSLDQAAGITKWLVAKLGRDATLTGRTDVWEQLFAAKTDSLLGTGFMSFWDDPYFQSKLPFWVSGSAHNGYLEIYLAGGVIGIGVLALMLLGVGMHIRQNLRTGDDYSIVRFAAYVITLIANLTESNYACMTSVGFLFLLTSLNAREPAPLTVDPTPAPAGRTEDTNQPTNIKPESAFTP